MGCAATVDGKGCSPGRCLAADLGLHQRITCESDASPVIEISRWGSWYVVRCLTCEYEAIAGNEREVCDMVDDHRHVQVAAVAA